jgi:hypothetical protein
MTNRRSILQEILDIDAQLNRVRRDPAYVMIKRNLGKLEKRRFGSVTVNVPTPDDLEKMVEIRVNSSEMREITSKYREMRAEFEVQISEILIRRASLQRELFKDSTS